MSTATQTAEEEALKNLGVTKSSYSLIDLAAKQIENRILLEDEVLNDSPASFTNIFLENFGRLGSQSFYEQMMYKNEMLPSTAIKLRSLINKMKASDISSIYAYPAHMTFVLGYDYDKLIELALANENQIVINKECIFSMEGQEDFILDHNIIIKLVNPGTERQNLYAIYDTSDKINKKSTLTEVNNIYIASQIINQNGKKIFGLFVNARQMTRTKSVINVTSNNPDFQIDFTDQLYGFELAWKGLSTKNFIYREGLFDGNISSDGYNFSIDIEEKKINFSFNRNPSYWSPSIGDEIEVTVYTTLGSKGNFKVPDIYNLYNQTAFSYRQNRDDPQQNALVYTNPYISIKDTGATGGRDSLGFEEIRKLVINRGTNSSILTPGDLERKVESFDFSVAKIRNDIRCLEYRASGVLENLPDIISSRDTTLSFDFTDIPINSEVSNRMITPKMIFEYNQISGRCEYKKEPGTYNDYFDEFQDNLVSQYLFPYHIRFIANNEITASVFNLNRNNDLYNLNFDFYNNNTSFESSVLNVIVNRNPITEDLNDIPKKSGIVHAKGYYDISFQITTSDVIIANLLSDEDVKIAKYKVLITDGENDYLAETYINKEEINEDENSLIVHAYLRTDDAINNSDKILIRDYSIQPVPFIVNPIEYYQLSDKISIKLIVVEKSESKSITTQYDNVLTSEEKNNLYFISTVYSASDVILFENYNKIFSLPSDLIISQKEYPRYESDVYEVYDTDEYVYDNEGNLVTETVIIESNGIKIKTEVSKILHKKGSFVFKDNIDMSSKELAKPIAILLDTTEEDVLANYTNSDLTNMITFDIELLSNEDKILYLKRFLNLDYEIFNDTENDITYIRDVVTKHILKEKTKTQLQETLNQYRIKTILHKAGEVNSSGAAIKDESYTAIIKKVPVYDRIYAIGSGYNQVLVSYETLVSQIETLQTYAPDGATMCLGIKNTAGRGEYEVYDMNTNTWQILDDIALSFDIGVKYSSDANNDVDADNAIIIETIRDYVNNFDGVSFGINTIFEKIKENLPSIEYMLLYKINQYSSAEVQSIRKIDGKTSVSDKLSVKQIIDLEKTDLNSGLVYFKPDISVRVIS